MAWMEVVMLFKVVVTVFINEEHNIPLSLSSPVIVCIGKAMIPRTFGLQVGVVGFILGDRGMSGWSLVQ